MVEVEAFDYSACGGTHCLNTGMIGLIKIVKTSAEPSISLHLLGNDVGCVLRHRFEPATGKVAPFCSGYTNQDCQAD